MAEQESLQYDSWFEDRIVAILLKIRHEKMTDVRLTCCVFGWFWKKHIAEQPVWCRQL
jgi:hypothetical protein